jgi:hypothetical protein
VRIVLVGKAQTGGAGKTAPHRGGTTARWPSPHDHHEEACLAPCCIVLSFRDGCAILSQLSSESGGRMRGVCDSRTVQDIADMGFKRDIIRPLGMAAMAIAVVFAIGCGWRLKALDEGELRDPFVRKAVEREQSGDTAGAIRAYTEALDRNPRLARAHLSLAFLYDRPSGDYLTALYHYRRYLELRPATEKKEMIEGRVRMAVNAFTASLLKSNPGLLKNLNSVRTENESLRVQVQDLREQLEELRAAQDSAAPPAPASLDPTVRPDGSVSNGAPVSPPRLRTYVVQANDSLRRIAARVYGDAERWKLLFDANRSSLKRPEDLKQGQILTLPP